MSVVPTITLPKCTRTAVIDLLFMRKHALTQTQMLVMYHLLMLKNWAKKTDDEFYIILSSKIEQDLNLGSKTVEASLTRLKKLNLIETKRCTVAEWNPDKTYRGVAITPLGKEYNLSYYKEKQYQHSKELEKENEKFRTEIDTVETQNRELQEKYIALQKENQKLKEQIEMQEFNTQPPKEKNLEDFRKKITRQYAQNGKPICNAVQNSDKWAIDIRFYINSYNRLNIYLPNGQPKQIADPKQVDNFWKWLFYHQNRVGKLLNEEKEADISLLLSSLGSSIILDDKLYKIESLKPVIGGVKVFLSNDKGELMEIGNGYGSKVIDVGKCREWFELCGVR